MVDFFDAANLETTIISVIFGCIGGSITKYIEMHYEKEIIMQNEKRGFQKNALYKLYLPMIRHLHDIRVREGECRNLTAAQARGILYHIEENYEFADEHLAEIFWEMSDEIMSLPDDVIVNADKLVHHISQQYEMIRSELWGLD